MSNKHFPSFKLSIKQICFSPKGMFLRTICPTALKSMINLGTKLVLVNLFLAPYDYNTEPRAAIYKKYNDLMHN